MRAPSVPPLFEKSSAPILSPLPELPWASGAVFNPGAWLADGRVHLLFRAVPGGYRKERVEEASYYESRVSFDDYVSYIGHAVSQDGVRFAPDAEPLIRPDSPFDRFGAEDPRVCALEGRYFITYTALSEPAFGREDGVRVGLASTTDFRRVEKHGVIGPAIRDKDAVLFPRLFDGRVLMLHRITPDVQLVSFDGVRELMAPPDALWRAHMAALDEHVVMRPEQPWEAKKIGAGPTPIETPDGWLLVYHGVDREHVYRAGLALLDLDDPSRVLARSARPVLEPELDFERWGDVDQVVFPEGAVVIGDDLHVYYGAADRVIGHARASLADVLAYLGEERAGRAPFHRVHMNTLGPDEPPRSIAAPPPVRPARLHGGRPVLEPVAAHPWESRVVLNPAAVLVEPGAELGALAAAWRLEPAERQRLEAAGGACVMLYRAQGEEDPEKRHAPSSIGLALFTPELELVRRRPEPVLRPGPAFQNLGAEDPRCTKVGDRYRLYYTGYGTDDPGGGTAGGRVRICLASTQDFLDWTLHGPLEGDVNRVPNKNPALLPVPVDGRWILLHRPMEGPRPMAVHWAEAERPEGPWTSRGLLMATNRFAEFPCSWVGAAGPPLRIDDRRFLMVYHQGHYRWDRRREYDLAAALLEVPAGGAPVVRARIEPLLRPEGPLETVGDPRLGVDNVVFSCANYRLGDRLVIPYAGADSRIFGAEVSFRALVRALETAAGA